jgi:hypothetical protein
MHSHQEYANVELGNELVAHVQEFAQGLLTFSKLSTANVVDFEESNDTVDDEQTVFSSHEHLGKIFNQRLLSLQNQHESLFKASAIPPHRRNAHKRCFAKLGLDPNHSVQR